MDYLIGIQDMGLGQGPYQTQSLKSSGVASKSGAT